MRKRENVKKKRSRCPAKLFIYRGFLWLVVDIIRKERLFTRLHSSIRFLNKLRRDLSKHYKSGGGDWNFR